MNILVCGAGGILRSPIVYIRKIPSVLQRTVLGEIDGRMTPLLKAIREAFRAAGFPTTLSSNIDAWLAWPAPASREDMRSVSQDFQTIIARSGILAAAFTDLRGASESEAQAE